jgi:AraC-like DNA-binding protein
MTQSRVFTFADSYAYEAAFRGTMELLVTNKGDFRAELIQIDLDRLWMQRGFDNLPRIVRSSAATGRAPIVFLADADQAPWQYDGVEVTTGEIVFLGQPTEHHHRTLAASRWATMSLTPEDLAVAGETIAGRALTIPLDTQVFRPAPAPMTRLMALHYEAEVLAKTAPDILARPAVAKALEQELVYAMVACLAGHMPAEAKSCGGHHARVIARFEDFLAAKRYEPVYLAEICAAVAVSERTLRTCCHKHLGMGPIHYLWLRRMHLARRALLHTDRAATTVTGIATDNGFWELGRFSVEYHALFGETPSASLHRPPDEALGQKAWN